MAVIGIAEFLKKVSYQKHTKTKVDALKHNDSKPLRIILQAAFDPDVKFALPAGAPPYTPNRLVDQENVLIREADKIKYFIEGFYPNMKPAKREQIFIEFLERLAPRDAELLVAIKDKKLPFKGITIQHVITALPGLIPNPGVKPLEIKEGAIEESNEEPEA
jgi:hypothetical protein